jgi:prepilin-type N-terminal cleavage/methylation domain-containing protein
MARPRSREGYTLVEVIIAILVFGVGVLGLAASSGVVAKAGVANTARERAGRMAASRIELVHSQCRNATSGEERSHQVYSQWVVAPSSISTVSVVESVTYPTSNGLRTDIYRAIVWCPQ